MQLNALLCDCDCEKKHQHSCGAVWDCQIEKKIDRQLNT